MKSNKVPIFLSVMIAWVILAELYTGYIKEKEAGRQYMDHISGQQHDSVWQAPNLLSDNETAGKERSMIVYGEDIIAHTSRYFGPHGTVAQTSNGMNCQNCHLDAGTRPWGNNYGAVYATYPQFRARSNSVQDINGRINDCFMRSLNGKALSDGSYELRSVYAYLKWLGKDVAKGRKPNSSGLPKLPFLNRAADPQKGKMVYIRVCQSCHGSDGQGVMNTGTTEYIYPPLWGGHSYNDGAGLYRLSSFASFVDNNMPFNQSSHEHTVLTNEEAWDIAAFVNSQSRPHFNQHNDWPDIAKKVFDVPFGPYADSFNERQHKYRPVPAYR